MVSSQGTLEEFTFMGMILQSAGHEELPIALEGVLLERFWSI